MNEKDHLRYEILRQLAVAGSRGSAVKATAERALTSAAELVGLSAAAMYLWDDQMSIKVSATSADSDESRRKLELLEHGLLRNLRSESELVAAYMSFGGDSPYHSFTLPLVHGDKIMGAVIGLQHGQRTIVSEDLFLEALSAAIAVHVVATTGAKAIPKDVLDKERLGAIVETAVTVNHEINNPLTAILGNVQLLLMKRDDLDPELRSKLEVIEASAGRIKDVTQKLLRLTTARTVDYSMGTSMIDISDEDIDRSEDE